MFRNIPFRNILLILIAVLLAGTILSPQKLYAQEPTNTPDTDTTDTTTADTIYLPLITQGDILANSLTEWPEDDAGDSAIAAPEEALWPEPEEAPLAIEELVQAAATAGPITTIASTEDYKALGFPDARKIVRNSQGHLYVAYRKKLGSRYRIYVAGSTDDGNSWQVTNGGQPIETVGDYTQRVPALAIDNQDQLHVVWYGNDVNNGDAANTSDEREIKYVRSADTTTSTLANLTWSSWVNLYDGGGYTGSSLWQEHPTIYVNGSNVYVVWESNETGNGRIKFIRSTDYGDSWSTVVDVQPSSRIYFSRPTLMVSYAGEARHLYLVAYGTKSGVARIFMSRSLDNGNSWEPWSAVAASKSDQRHVAMARDDAGRLHIVWRQVSNTRTILRYRLYDPNGNQGSGGWSDKPRTIATVRNQCLYFPTIAVSGKNWGSDTSENDRVWVVWSQSDDCTTIPSDDPVNGTLYLVSRPVNGNWSKPQAVTATGRHLYPSLRRANSPTSSAGNVDLVWLNATASPTIPVSNRPSCEAGSCVIQHVSLGAW